MGYISEMPERWDWWSWVLGVFGPWLLGLGHWEGKGGE